MVLAVITLSKCVITRQFLAVLLHLTMSGWDYSSLKVHINVFVGFSKKEP